MGREREALLGQCIDGLIHPDDRPEIATLFAELASGKRTNYQLIGAICVQMAKWCGEMCGSR
ncbi:hypothetical protein [Chromatium okenii]|uniref:hypothetical protein n=1 Tax=Chromatium okenii TaxID=61644 RepID=UPI00155854A8